MKKKMVLRCLPCLLAGLLLWGSPVRAFAAENSRVTVDQPSNPEAEPPKEPESIKLDSVEIQTIEAADMQSLNISWNLSQNAEGYELYRSSVSGSGYALVADLPAGTEAYRDTGLSIGSTYYYRVRAYMSVDGQKTYTDYSAEAGRSVSLGGIVGLSARMLKSTTIELSWDPLPNAKKYEVYYSTSPNSGFKRAGSAAKNVYKFSKAKCGQTYYFKVCAQGKVNKVKYFSDESEIIESSTSLVGVPEVYVAKSTYNGITIMWNKIKDAKKYEIYYATEPEGPYQLLKTQSSNKYTHKGMAIGTACYYKVRAIRDYYITDFSEPVAGRVDLAAVQDLKITSGAEQLKLSWKKVSGAQSYAIFRSDSEDGVYSEVGISKGKSYTDKGLQVSTVYYYKVYAMRGQYRMDEATAVGQTTLSVTAAEAKPAESSDSSNSSSSSSNKKTYYGVDVSSYQGKIDWKAVSNDGIDFAMIRILTGRGTSNLDIDTWFEYNYEHARSAGIKVGVYRYSYATTKSGARQEASRIVEVLNGRKLDYPIVLDMEDSSVLNQTTREKRTEIIQAYKKVVEDAGYKFALYANKDWLENHIEPEALKGIDIWYARWRSLSSGSGYNGSGNLTMWQYTNSGSVKGISGKVDLNVSYKKY